MNIIDLQQHLEKLSLRFDSFEAKLTRIDEYIDKEINYKEFKANQKKSVRQMLGGLGILVTIIISLTGWGFFEKGLHTPVPLKNPITLNANN